MQKNNFAVKKIWEMCIRSRNSTNNIILNINLICVHI